LERRGKGNDRITNQKKRYSERELGGLKRKMSIQNQQEGGGKGRKS